MTKLRILLSLLLFVACNFAYAQEIGEMADTMRSNGKIYVIVAIILIVLVGLISYLFVLDRKITKLEKEFPVKKKLTSTAIPPFFIFNLQLWPF